MPSSSSRNHNQADSYAESAERAKERGENGRYVRLFEHALNFEIDAINACLKEQPVDGESIHQLFLNAARYAKECGRQRKADYLLAEASRLMGNTEADFPDSK